MTPTGVPFALVWDVWQGSHQSMSFTQGHLDTLGASMSQLAKYQALHGLL